MKSKQAKSINLIEEGKANWEKTIEFNKKVDAIRQEILVKYNLMLFRERNWFKRQLIMFQRMIELKKRIEEISSWKNLHIGAC
jgi:hypothetical protein